MPALAGGLQRPAVNKALLLLGERSSGGSSQGNQRRCPYKRIFRTAFPSFPTREMASWMRTGANALPLRQRQPRPEACLKDP